MTEEHQQTTCVEHTSLVSPLISRHIRKLDRQQKTGALNIRSVNNKVDDVLGVMGTYNLHIALSETWHENSDSVTIKRLRSLGLNVLEVARPILEDIDDNITFVHHGGLAIDTKPGIITGNLNMKLNATTFEFL